MVIGVMAMAMVIFIVFFLYFTFTTKTRFSKFGRARVSDSTKATTIYKTILLVHDFGRESGRASVV